MPRNVPPLLLADLKKSSHTLCGVLKVIPKNAPSFGLSSTNIDVVYDDGKGAMTYRARRGYTPTDLVTRADLTVDNAEANGLISQYPLDGVTLDGIARGDYDGARFAQYLINYANPTHGHVQLNGGCIGQITSVDDLAAQIELRSLTQVLKQNSVVELTSITCRAQFGDERCKMPLIWKPAIVTTVGAEADRTFGFVWAKNVAAAQTMIESSDARNVQLLDGDDSSATLVSGRYNVFKVYIDGVPTEDYVDTGHGELEFQSYMDGSEQVTWDGVVEDTVDGYPGSFILPGLVHWKTGENAERENEIEDITSDGFTLSIPTRALIAVGDVMYVRRDCDKSKAMCIDYGNLPNMRGEPDTPRADGTDLQAATPSS